MKKSFVMLPLVLVLSACGTVKYGVEVESMLYNPGGATICTRSNAMNEMSFNTKLGIYEQN